MQRRLFLASSVAAILKAQTQAGGKLRFIAIGAHPDDCDIKFGGTAILLTKAGQAVKFLSVTNGDAGHHEMGGAILAKRRKAETQESAKRLGIAEYEVLDNHDGELTPTLDVRRQVIRAIRGWNADVVIAPRPNDYHPDHRYTGVLVQDAAYMVQVPNVVSDVPALRKNPVFLYYSDNFQRPNPFRPDVAVDIGTAFEQKMDALDAQVSQFYEWLPWVAGRSAEVPKDAKERRAWLAKQRAYPQLAQSTKAALEKWYGRERAGAIQYVEAFEVCEYGRQPSEAELKGMFPMLGQ